MIVLVDAASVFFKVEGDEAKAQELTKKLDAKLVAYEKILAKQKYLAGDVSDTINSSIFA